MHSSPACTSGLSVRVPVKLPVTAFVPFPAVSRGAGRAARRHRPADSRRTLCGTPEARRGSPGVPRALR